MAKVDFYTLQKDSKGDRFQLACKLIQRIYTANLRMEVVCQNQEESQTLDRLLWTFKQESFIPHGLSGTTDPDLTAVFISTATPSGVTVPVLINLCQNQPDNWSIFERVCELVDQQPVILQSGRQRFRQYIQQGITPEHHQITL